MEDYPEKLKRIAIDEIYVGKKRYLTVVLDILSGAVVFVGDGKGSDALEPFWQRLRRYRKVKIEAVAIDSRVARGTFPPRALTEPDVNVSAHPAPIVQPMHTTISNEQTKLAVSVQYNSTTVLLVSGDSVGVCISASPT